MGINKTSVLFHLISSGAVKLNGLLYLIVEGKLIKYVTYIVNVLVET